MFGADWLGDVLFVCVGPESDEFLKIMEYEGWNDNQYVTFPDVSEVYDRCIDFHNAWKWTNGPSNFSYNMNYVPVERLQERGLIPVNDNDIQIWTGRNDIAFQLWGGVDWSLECSYKHNYSAVTSVVQYKAGDVVFPLMNYKLMKILAGAKVRVGWETLRMELLRHMDPGLFQFERVVAKFPPLTDKQLDKVCRDYSLSWYGTNVYPPSTGYEDTTSMINHYHDWWSRWTCAVIVEHLIEEGYEISVG